MIASESSCRITPISDSCVAGGSAGSVRSHLYELPTNRQSGLLPRRQLTPPAVRETTAVKFAPVWLMREIAVSQVPWMAVGEPS